MNEYPLKISAFDGWSKEKLQDTLKQVDREIEGQEQAHQAKMAKYQAYRKRILKELEKHANAN